MNTQLRSWLIVLVLGALGLAGCAPGSTPQLIGTYPRSGLAAPPADLRIVYSSALTLEVWDVDAAAERAVTLASDYGGYLVESRAWQLEGRQQATLSLAVPAPNFDELRQALLDLGTLIEETVSSQPKPIYPEDWSTFTQITLSLRSAAPALKLPDWPGNGWNPARTFGQAFAVTAAIFAFVADILIWALVVVGPFVLVGLGLRALWRRSGGKRP